MRSTEFRVLVGRPLSSSRTVTYGLAHPAKRRHPILRSTQASLVFLKFLHPTIPSITFPIAFLISPPQKLFIPASIRFRINTKSKELNSDSSHWTVFCWGRP